ncbi:MAG: hypothetical protein HY372_02745 [Candidatus Andersenbacteria bacterium]|nr:hypothetical protein [Candidatus Andersenbacteria bacterium]
MRILSPKIILSAAGIIVLFILISLVQEMNRRMQVQREISRLEHDVRALEKTVVEMENLNQYFRTDAFQERMAREKLNYRALGEHVVLLPEGGGTNETDTAAEPLAVPRSIPLKWWQAFFGLLNQ